MRAWRTSWRWTLGLTAMFALAQLAAGLFLIQRLRALNSSGEPSPLLLGGLVLLLVGAELLTALGESRPE